MRCRRDTGPDLFQPRCPQCDRVMVRTPSGYLACPEGHGGLHLDPGTLAAPVEEPCGSWFDADSPAPE